MEMHALSGKNSDSAGLRWLTTLAFVAAVCAVSGCVTVRPEQRAVLADPVMQFNGEQGEREALDHILENREGSYGGGSVKGGGCGCN